MNNLNNKKKRKGKINNKDQEIENYIKKEIKENYEIGIEYYEDVEENKN